MPSTNTKIVSALEKWRSRINPTSKENNHSDPFRTSNLWQTRAPQGFWWICEQEYHSRPVGCNWVSSCSDHSSKCHLHRDFLTILLNLNMNMRHEHATLSTLALLQYRTMPHWRSSEKISTKDGAIWNCAKMIEQKITLPPKVLHSSQAEHPDQPHGWQECLENVRDQTGYTTTCQGKTYWLKLLRKEYNLNSGGDRWILVVRWAVVSDASSWSCRMRTCICRVHCTILQQTRAWPCLFAIQNSCCKSPKPGLGQSASSLLNCGCGRK